MELLVEARTDCIFFELASSQVVVKRHASVFAIVGQKNIGVAIVVVIDEASAGTETRVQTVASGRRNLWGQPSGARHIHKPHLDLRGRFQHCRRRFHCARVLALLAVSQAHGCADFVLRDVLKFLQVLAGVVDFGGLLVSPRESELGRGVQRVELQRVLKGVDGLRKLFRLHVSRAQEIPGVRLIRVDLSYVTKGLNRGRSIASIFGQQAEVIPCVGVLRILLERILQHRFGFLDLLHIQQGDAFIEASHREIRIKLRCLLECLESFLEKLLVHVGGAEIIHARSFDGIRLWLSLRAGREEAKGGREYAGESG